jgi:hypothetical protein
MRWVRDNIRQGSWIALVAIAINLALSFGHTHVTGYRDSESRLAAAVLVPPGHDNPKDRSDHADYLCPICVAASTIANSVAPTPPAIPLQLSEVAVDRPVEPVHFAMASPRAAFQSRGPPTS